MLGTILLVLLVLLLIGALPAWPHARARGWGWTPSGVVGVALIVLLILILLGQVNVGGFR